MPLVFAMIALISQQEVDLSYLQTLPRPDSHTFHDHFWHGAEYAPARVLLAELLEERGRHSEAITWARAEIQVRLSPHF